MSKGRIIRGIECPIIRKGDDLIDIVSKKILETTEETREKRVYSYSQQLLLGIDRSPVYTDSTRDTYRILEETDYTIEDKDIIGITESVVARAAGQYITVDDIAKDVEKKFGKDATVCLVNPIYSRNRFSMILKGIARASKKIIIVMPEYDEVGNPRGVNPFTGVNIEEYYKELCKNEDCKCEISSDIRNIASYYCHYNYVICNLHNDTIEKSLNSVKNSIKEQVYDSIEGPLTDYDHECVNNKINDSKIFTLFDICSGKSPDWGVLGTNKATEEMLKLFPSKAECQRVCEGVKALIKELTGKDVIVCVYGDGCYKDATSGIWEFADPTTMPGYTDKDLIESSPHEIKLKSLIDSNEKKDFASDEELKAFVNKCKSETSGRINNMSSMGTTPRIYRDLIASLMDLTSGSGDKATPVVLVQNYF